MQSDSGDPLKRRVPAKQVVLIAGGAIYFLVAALVAVENRTIGLAMLAPLAAWLLIAPFLMSREEKQKLGAALEENDKKPMPQLMKVVNLALLLLVAFAALKWAYGRL
jgi:hypothetical protein